MDLVRPAPTALEFRPVAAPGAPLFDDIPIVLAFGVALLAFFVALACMGVPMDRGAPLWDGVTPLALLVGGTAAATTAAIAHLALRRFFLRDAQVWEQAFGDSLQRRSLLLAATALDVVPSLRALPAGTVWSVLWLPDVIGGQGAVAWLLTVRDGDKADIEVSLGDHPALLALRFVPCPSGAFSTPFGMGLDLALEMPAPSTHTRLALRHAVAAPAAPRPSFRARLAAPLPGFLRPPSS